MTNLKVFKIGTGAWGSADLTLNATFADNLPIMPRLHRRDHFFQDNMFRHFDCPSPHQAENGAFDVFRYGTGLCEEPHARLGYIIFENECWIEWNWQRGDAENELEWVLSDYDEGFPVEDDLREKDQTALGRFKASIEARNVAGARC